MSPHAAVPDGQPDQIVDVALVDPSPVQYIVIQGLNEAGDCNGDDWRFPDTGYYWHIRARSLPDDTLRLWMSRSRSCTRVSFKVQHLSGRQSRGIAPVLAAPTAPATPSPKPPVAPDPEPIFRLRVTELEDALAAAQREIARLQAHIEELAALKPAAERWRALRRLITED